MEQASDRCHRIGQEDTVTEWWFVAENTIDEDIINLLTAKQSTIGAVVDGDENSGAVPTSMIDAATQALLQRTGK
jgi:SNF2 family DNA or RNA helicase